MTLGDSLGARSKGLGLGARARVSFKFSRCRVSQLIHLSMGFLVKDLLAIKLEVWSSM